MGFLGLYGLLNEVSIINAMDGSDNCQDGSYLGYWGLIFWIFIDVFFFIGLYVLCEEYFVPTMMYVSKRLELSEDIAGASFMAMGSSSPELFVGLIGVIFYEDENPGPATNTASAGFNLCVVVSLSLLLSGYKSFKLDSYAFKRDAIFVVISIIEITFIWEVINRGSMSFGGAFLMVFTYLIYILILVFDENIKLLLGVKSFDEINDKTTLLTDKKDVQKVNELINHNEYFEVKDGKIVDPSTKGKPKFKEVKDGKPVDTSGNEMSLTTFNNDNSNINTNQDSKIDIDIDAPYDETPQMLWTQSFFKQGMKWNRCFNFCSGPFHFIFHYTIPHLKSVTDSSTTPAIFCSFFMCIFWMAFITFICVDASNKIGKCLGLTPDICGLTILAYGASLGDCISAILSAKQGKGKMAVSCALGSAIFEILICIGFSFMIKSIFTGLDSVDIERSTGFSAFIWILLCVSLFFIIIIWKFKYVLDKIIAYALLITYAFFMIASIILLQAYD